MGSEPTFELACHLASGRGAGVADVGAYLCMRYGLMHFLLKSTTINIQDNRDDSDGPISRGARRPAVTCAICRSSVRFGA
jgi:hypothetical protein